jgi:hypothetical protein
MVPVSDEEHERIVEMLRGGHSQNAVAKALGRSPGTINRISQQLGLEYSTPTKAIEARIDYALEQRLDLLNAGFEKARELLDGIDRPSQLMQWAIALGTLTDKRRLEDGEATSRSEVTNVDDARARIASKLDELAQRRRTRSLAS